MLKLGLLVKSKFIVVYLRKRNVKNLTYKVSVKEENGKSTGVESFTFADFDRNNAFKSKFKRRVLGYKICIKQYNYKVLYKVECEYRTK